VACPEEGDLAGWVVEAGVRWTPLAIRRPPGPSDARALAQLRALAGEADVLHLHSSKAGAVGRVAAATRFGRRPALAFTPHGLSWYAGGPLAPAYRLAERTLAPLADAIIAVSSEERDAAAAVMGNRARIRIIENAVDTTRFSPDGPRADRTGDPLVVCVGRIRSEKGQDVAIRALALMKTPAVRLRLVGDGPDRVECEALAAALGVADRVEFAGRSSEPAAHLRAADVVVVPSRYDGMSLTMLEAMAVGAPMVATAVNGSSAAAGAAEIVPVAEAAAMAAATDRLLADRSRAIAMGRQARQRAVDRFDQLRYNDEHVALWHELAALRAQVERSRG
jgi:glycosyltransferase involved in cell wall biosynthesis